MKPLKKHRLSISKRYFGRVTRGLMQLVPEKSIKATNEAISSEYNIDLTTVCDLCYHLLSFIYLSSELINMITLKKMDWQIRNFPNYFQAAISCDDSRRRLLFKFKKESRDIGPVNKNEYDTFKGMIQKHRNYRQSVNRFRYTFSKKRLKVKIIKKHDLWVE